MVVRRNCCGKIIKTEARVNEVISSSVGNNPSRIIELSELPKNVQEAISTEGKPVIIKKNIFEKNKSVHKELTPSLNREILRRIIYTPNLVGTVQPIKFPYYRGSHTDCRLQCWGVFGLYAGKENVEIVGW